ncbi:hypothetical protein L5515_015100 [Caenorhabditis briggsae]|uniref:Uncharacterized protein n=1 Tax=Caenorhabditis briggsae TaxID=6238 RepID=A0AAE9J9L6_CAEBR|nr:hypothetical protein L5515_015100 [Caenorhabditis briggsae]
MPKFIFLILCSSLFFIYAESSLSQWNVKEGEEVPIEFEGAKKIKRSVSSGDQIFYFDGPNKGKMVDENGKVVDSSNFKISNGTLVIKKFSKADEGSYSEEPNMIMTKTEHGFSGVPGETLVINIEP